MINALRFNSRTSWHRFPTAGSQKMRPRIPPHVSLAIRTTSTFGAGPELIDSLGQFPPFIFWASFWASWDWVLSDLSDLGVGLNGWNWPKSLWQSTHQEMLSTGTRIPADFPKPVSLGRDTGTLVIQVSSLQSSSYWVGSTAFWQALGCLRGNGPQHGWHVRGDHDMA